MLSLPASPYVRAFATLRRDDVPTVGGKNASLGEMLHHLAAEGIRVPDGFSTTVEAYRAFLAANDLDDAIRDALAAWTGGDAALAETGAALRARITEAPWPDAVAGAMRDAYAALSARYDTDAVDVAVRSSATAEDLPEASFAGQQATFLHVTGPDAVLDAARRCLASLFTDRALDYRATHGFDHRDVALAVGVQKMVNADVSGVMFTLDPDTGFPDVAVLNAAWGLGEGVVSGRVTPDQFTVYTPFLDDDALAPVLRKTHGAKEEKVVFADGGGTEVVPTSEAERAGYVLTDDDALHLARWGRRIAQHYGRPMDVEWARDGATGDFFVLQARPETVQARADCAEVKTYTLADDPPEPLVQGLAIGQAIATGCVCRLDDPSEQDAFVDGAILVTDRTDPDWGPILKRAGGIVTDRGGRTSHAAIVSREMGLPALVGVGDATEVLADGQAVTLHCADGDAGYVYDGELAFHEETIDLGDAPTVETRVMLNIASPSAALRWWRLPVRGVGLARMEYVINNVIQIHPLALVHFDELEDADAKARIADLTARYEDKTAYFVDHLARGLATIAAVHHPEPVIVRMSDFKTNEYADLIGGRAFEPAEENPMLGWRGAARYYDDAYRAGFALECQALRRVRETMGFTNVVAMIPFCRTPAEGDRVLAAMAEHGLVQGEHGLKVYVMAEVPSNILEAEAFAERFDGFSIGTNDLTQLALGIGRDAERLAALFDERSPTVKRLIRMLIDDAHAAGRPVGLCGQAPSDHPDFAAFLVEAGIDSISLTPDSVVATLHTIAEAEAARRAPAAKTA